MKLATCLKLDISGKKRQSSPAECQWHTQSHDALGIRLTDLYELPFTPHPPSTLLYHFNHHTSNHFKMKNPIILSKNLHSTRLTQVSLICFWNMYLSLNFHFKYSDLIYKVKLGPTLFKPILATHTVYMLWKSITIE